MWVATTGTAFPAEVDTYVPDGVTARQLRAIVEKYVREHPAELHADAAGLVYVAVREAWPCPTGAELGDNPAPNK